MLVGLDVGGTNTDAVVVDAESGACLARAKAATHPGDVFPGVLSALQTVLGNVDATCVERIAVSTTLGLNALLTGSTEPVGVLAVPGPGIDPRTLWPDDPLLHVIGGAMDHRGRVTAPLDSKQARNALRVCREQGARALAVVGKFSPKNPELEDALAVMAEDVFSLADNQTPLVKGAALAGVLNFPRRLHTAWCNAALTRLSRDFFQALSKALSDFGVACPLVVLKADAGVFSADNAVRDPAGSMGSGPAASLLGVWALAGETQDDLLMIDMGGTSTDLAILARGHPLLSRKGLSFAGRPTLVRGLLTRSLALGGDSSLRITPDGPRIGPDRMGPALAVDENTDILDDNGGLRRPPTLTDALVVLGLARMGTPQISYKALEHLASAHNLAHSAQSLARMFVDVALEHIRTAANDMVAHVNAEPVYTIRELLISDPITPQRAVLIGGPAVSLASEVESALAMPVIVPETSSCANAIGTALARQTFAAELYADTQLGWMRIPDLGIDKRITGKYTLDEAHADMLEAFMRKGDESGLRLERSDVQIVYEESFAMLDERGSRGRILRMRAQRAAGLVGAVTK